jgi:hypothetical protein
LWLIAVGVPNEDEASGITKRKRTEENGAHHTEHQTRGGEAEGEGQDPERNRAQGAL